MVDECCSASLNELIVSRNDQYVVLRKCVNRLLINTLH